MSCSRAARRTPTLLLSLPDRDEAELTRFLAARDINAPTGHFYAIAASRHLGLGDDSEKPAPEAVKQDGATDPGLQQRFS